MQPIETLMHEHRLIEKVLTAAGYPPNAGEPPVLVHSTSIKRDPQWEILGVRVTETNPADLK